MSGVSRRGFLAGGVALGVGIGIGVPLLLSNGPTPSTGGLLRSTAALPALYSRPFRMPPELRPVAVGAAGDRFALAARLRKVEILPGLLTTVFAYGGSVPGPTIRTRRGREAVVSHRNELPVPMVVHLHGGHTPHDSDGYPTDLVLPADRSYYERRMDGGHGMALDAGTGPERDYHYPMDQRAATLWYHDHRMGFTGPAVWYGLAGFHLNADDEEDALALPSGRHELLLMLADRSFGRDGEFLYPSLDRALVNEPGVTPGFAAGVLGDVMLVNGTPTPEVTVDRTSYRLRILNACNARRLDLRLTPAPYDGMVQIGTDGGLLAAPITHTHIELAPAQRVDLLIDFSQFPAGTRVELVNDFDGGRMHHIMRFTVGESTSPPYRVPPNLSNVETLEESQVVRTRSFRFRRGDVEGMSGWIIGGAPFDPDTAQARVRLGDVEVWELFADFHHPVHVHLDPFQVVSRGISGPGAFDAGWKDTIDLRPSEQARILVRFSDYAGRFVFHCHNLEHEDMAMMANFDTY